MIIERRAYTLRPGTSSLFWQAQRDLNSTGPYSDAIDAHNLSFFETMAGPSEQIVQINRFESLEQWKATGDHILRTYKGEYFSVARPLLLQQENGFYVPAPLDALKPVWAGGHLPSPVIQASEGENFSLCVMENIVDLRPGGLLAYWDAYKALLKDGPDNTLYNLMFVANSIVGALNRVVEHRWFSTVDAALDHQLGLQGSMAWHRFTEAYRPFVNHSHLTYLRPAPLAKLRSIFTG